MTTGLTCDLVVALTGLGIVVVLYIDARSLGDKV